MSKDTTSTDVKRSVDVSKSDNVNKINWYKNTSKNTSVNINRDISDGTSKDFSAGADEKDQ